MRERNYDDEVLIDEMALDVEWLEQSALMRKYTRIEAEAKRDMNSAKEYQDFIKATLDRDIRKDPDKFGAIKVTEPVVTSTILLQLKYQAAAKATNDTRYAYDIASGVVKAFEQRKTALENLVKLLGQSYFAGPVTPRDLSSEYLEKAKRKNGNNKIVIGKKSKSLLRPDTVDEVLEEPTTVEDNTTPKALRRKKRD